MQLSAIKDLITQFSPEVLAAAEEAILNEESPSILIPGKDEGEQLTHVMAARWIQDDMKSNDRDLRNSLREYSKKVRKSID